MTVILMTSFAFLTDIITLAFNHGGGTKMLQMNKNRGKVFHVDAPLLSP